MKTKRFATLSLMALLCLLVLATSYQAQAAGGLLLWNRLGSDAEVTNSEVGPNGVIVGSQYAYEAAQFDSGYVTKSRDESEHVAFPGAILHGLNERGTIELWINPKVTNPVPFQYGVFALIGTPNTGWDWHLRRGNVWLYWGDGVTGNGLFGGVTFEGQGAQTPSEPTQFVATIGQPFHAAIAWDIAGINGTSDTIRVYRDGVMVGSTTNAWNASGAMLLDCFWLGQAPDSSGYDKFIVDNILVWDHAVTNFSHRFSEDPIVDATVSLAAENSFAVSGHDVNFPDTILGSEDVTIDATEATWTVIDTTHTGTGWHTTFSASDFDDGDGHTIDVSHFALRLDDADIAVVGNNNSPLPTSQVPSYTALSVSGLTALAAGSNEGMGLFTFVPQFRLTIPATTTIGDNPFTTVVVATMIVGP